MSRTPPSLKASLRRMLEDIGLYHRVKTSWVYDLYWSIADKRVIDDRKREIDFYHRLLDGFRKGDLVFDIGANHGYKSGIFLKLGAKVVSVEPDETSREILKQNFLRYRLAKKPLTIVAKAISDRRSLQRMWIDTPGSAKNTLSQKWAETLRHDTNRFGHTLSFGYWIDIETATIDELMAEHGTPFFIKIDVEGHELSVLHGMRRTVPYLSFEVNLPEFRREGAECVQVLNQLTQNGRFNYTSDCRDGLVLKEWVTAEEFQPILKSCTDSCTEVFWRSPTSAR